MAQNIDPLKQAIIEELQKLLSPSNEVLKSGQERIRQLEYTEGFGVHLVDLVMSQSMDLALRQIACSVLTRHVENHWGEGDDDERSACIIQDHTKRSIRSILPNGLYDPNTIVRSMVAHTLSTITTHDWPDKWPELFDIIVKCLGGNEDSIHGALIILEEFSYDRKHIREYGAHVISEVYRILVSEQLYSLKTRSLAVRILRCLWVSIQIHIEDAREQTQLMNSILSSFVEKLLHYLSTNSGDASNFAMKTDIVKLIGFICADSAKVLQPYMARILPVVWQLLTQVAEVYVKVHVNQTEPSPFLSTGDPDRDEDEICELSTMLVQTFEFIENIVVQSKGRGTIKSVLADLIYIMIVYSQVPEELTEVWNDDAERFALDEEECGVELTVRYGALQVLQAITEVFGLAALPPLQEALRRHMNVAEAEKAAGNPHWWKIQEASLYAVWCFDELILEAEDEFDFTNFLSLVGKLLHYEESTFLVGRALFILSTYSRSERYTGQMLNEILDFTLRSLQPDKPMVLKISALRAINAFVGAHEKSNDEKRALVLTRLPGFVEGMVGMVPDCKSGVLCILLESLTIIAKFDHAFTASVQYKVVPLTLAIFVRYSEDPYLQSIVEAMVKILAKIPQCQQVLQEKFVPIIVNILSLPKTQPSAEKQDLALDLLATIVRHASAPLSPLLMETAFPMFIQCVQHSDESSVLVAGGECLRAYIHASPEQVCAYKNGEGLNCIIQVTTQLLNPMTNENTAAQAGRLVITIITKMASILGENVDLLLKAVISKMQLVDSLKVIMSLVVIFAHLFLTQMEAILNFLSTVPGPMGEPAIQFVLRNWLSRQGSFYGAYERKVTTMALCKLFEYGITTQDSRLTSITVQKLVIDESAARVKTRSQAAASQHWVTIPALVSIFKLLVCELGHLKESEGVDNQSDSEDDADSERTPTSPRYVSELYFDDDEDDRSECSEDDDLTAELQKDPLFRTNIKETLTKFLQNFSGNEHFGTFVEHLAVNERLILKSIDVHV